MIIQQWTTWQKYIFVCWKLRVWLKSKTSIFLMLKVHFKSTFQYFAIFCRWINCVEFSSIEFVKGKVGRCVCNQKYFAVEFNLGIYWPPTRICVEGVGADIYETHLALRAPRFWVEFATQKRDLTVNWNPQKRSLMIQQFCSIFASWEWPMFDLKTLPQSQDSNCLKRQGGKNLENKSAIEFCCKLSKCMLLHSLGICKYNDFVWSQICENQWSMAWTDNNMNVQIWLEKSSNGHFLEI